MAEQSGEHHVKGQREGQTVHVEEPNEERQETNDEVTQIRELPPENGLGFFQEDLQVVFESECSEHGHSHFVSVELQVVSVYSLAFHVVPVVRVLEVAPEVREIGAHERNADFLLLSDFVVLHLYQFEVLFFVRATKQVVVEHFPLGQSSGLVAGVDVTRLHARDDFQLDVLEPVVHRQVDRFVDLVGPLVAPSAQVERVGVAAEFDVEEPMEDLGYLGIQFEVLGQLYFIKVQSDESAGFLDPFLVVEDFPGRSEHHRNEEELQLFLDVFAL